MRVGKTRFQVWWHCLVRTFSREHGGNVGLEEAWSMIEDLMVNVLRGIADCAIADPAALAREALKALEFEGLDTLPTLQKEGPTPYRVVGVEDEHLAPMVCREANGLIVTTPTLHGEDCRCTFLPLRDDFHLFNDGYDR